MTSVCRLSRHTFPATLLLFILLWISATSSAKADGSFSVAPGVFLLNLSKSHTDSILLTNTSERRIRLMIKPVYFAVDSRQLNAGSSLNRETAAIENIAKAIIVSPRVLVLAPGQKRSVRFSVRNRAQSAPGDYRAHLLIKTLEGKQPDLKAGANNTDGMSIRLKLKVQTAVAIYGRIGAPDTKLESRCLRDEKGNLVLEMINKSKWNYRGWLGIYGVASDEGVSLLKMVRLISLRESKRMISLQLPFDKALELRWGETQENLTSGKLQYVPSL